MAERATVRWLVRLSPVAGRTVDDLLKVPLSLDVWERETAPLWRLPPNRQLSRLSAEE